ncbi:uncharacterized protein LOC144737961 isoform X3 [Lampetra planeri]
MGSRISSNCSQQRPDGSPANRRPMQRTARKLKLGIAMTKLVTMRMLHGHKRMLFPVLLLVLAMAVLVVLILGSAPPLILPRPHMASLTPPPRGLLSPAPMGRHARADVRLHKVGTSRVLAFSAYLDTRGDGQPLLRVFALAPRGPPWLWPWQWSWPWRWPRWWWWSFGKASCRMFYGDAEPRRALSVAATPKMLSNHYKFEFAVFNFLCRVPKGEALPSHVALVMDVEGGASSPSSIFSSVLMPVQNREPSPPRHHFGVCLPTLFGGFSDALLLVQSMELYRLLGAGFVTVYNTSVSPQVDALLRHYARSGFMDVQQWPITDFLKPSTGWDINANPGDLHYYGQIATLNDCLYRNMYRARYLAMHDLDEIIIPREWPNWPKMMEALSKHGASAYYFRMHNFPVAETATRVSSSGLRVHGTDILGHVDKVTYPPGDVASKVLLQPRGIEFHDVHRVLALRPGHGLRRVPDSQATVQHYKRWRKDWDFPSHAELTRDMNLLRYAGDIERAVKRTLDAIGDDLSTELS